MTDSEIVDAVVALERRLDLAMAMLSRLVAGHASGVVHPEDWNAAREMVRGWEGPAAGEASKPPRKYLACPSCHGLDFWPIIGTDQHKCKNCGTVSETPDLVQQS